MFWEASLLLSQQNQSNIYCHGVSRYPDIIFATVKINDAHHLCLKVDLDAVTCVLTLTGLQHITFSVNMKLSTDILFAAVEKVG